MKRLSLCLVEVILQRESKRRESLKRNNMFLLFGMKRIIEERVRNYGTHMLFDSLHMSEESGDEHIFPLLPMLLSICFSYMFIFLNFLVSNIFQTLLR
jgi:hypothetical protein